jgi:ABC-type transport system substrate-binding protein
MSNQRTRRNTRRLVVHVVISALVVAMVAGVSLAASPPDTLIWDIAAGPQYVDPVMGTAAQANVMVVQNVYERLVWYGTTAPARSRSPGSPRAGKSGTAAGATSSS